MNATSVQEQTNQVNAAAGPVTTITPYQATITQPQAALAFDFTALINQVVPIMVFGAAMYLMMRMMMPRPAGKAKPATGGPITSYRAGRFPPQDAELRKFRNYDIVEVHDDGDLTIRAGGFLWVFTTDGQVFRQMELPG
ncbi:MAG: hypothetical protein Q8O40_02945 [Chloroflexota bacterium]|nr:hypothetical protein [Chloroflexota bacterium]